MAASIVEVRFHKGENKQFVGAREAAKAGGYPDVPTYLRFTGRVHRWCEEIPQKEFEVGEIARRMRAKAQLIGQRYPITGHNQFN